MTFDWEKHKPLIERLTLGQNHTLKEIIAEVRKIDPSFTARQAYLLPREWIIVDSV
jgi:hypothetical protein